MSFMSSYKLLDHLCQGIYPEARNGISGYIEDMESHPKGAYQVRGWDEDYKALKHYRWLRNQISHEVYADEATMCEPGDMEWLENFYQRIMNQTEPLALAYQASKPRVQKATALRTYRDIPQHTDFNTSPQPKTKGWGTLVIALFLLAIGAALALTVIAILWFK